MCVIMYIYLKVSILPPRLALHSVVKGSLQIQRSPSGLAISHLRKSARPGCDLNVHVYRDEVWSELAARDFQEKQTSAA